MPDEWAHIKLFFSVSDFRDYAVYAGLFVGGHITRMLKE